ncbi:hypothetical protein MKW92_003195 [Papaver armeniacum]|nr:hypothetical protein MKW92_003195 [Papaver armeniacum]
MGGFLNSGAEANSVRRWYMDATLVFGSDGNLILADTNGQVAIRGDGSNKLASGSYSMSMERTIHLTLSSIQEIPTFYLSYLYLSLVSYEDIDTEQERRTWDEPGYNTTLSMLRLDKDGNLRVYTYNGNKNTWENSYMYFSSQVSECNAEKCGVYREPIPSCETSKPETVDCYKMEDVTSSMRSFNDWDFKEMTVDDCKMICSKDCKCGFLLQEKLKSLACLLLLKYLPCLLITLAATNPV